MCQTANKKPTLQTLFFTHDVITSSNYAYLSLQTHQLSAISAVIGNRFTVVKLQFKCHGLCTISEEESCVVPNEVLFYICSLPVFENNYSI